MDIYQTGCCEVTSDPNWWLKAWNYLTDITWPYVYMLMLALVNKD